MNEDKSPKIILEGTIFRIDVDSQSLIELENPGNRIPKTAMIANGHFWTLVYDASCRNFPTPECRLLPRGGSIREITLPEELFGLKAMPDDKQAASYNQLSHLNNWGYLLVNEDLHRYLSGEKPTLDIAGTRYYLDLDENQLKPVFPQTYPAINLDQADFSEDSNRTVFFYNLETKSAVDLPTDLKTLNNQVVLVEIPDLLKIAPIDVARMLGVQDGTFFNPSFTFRLHQEATLISLEKVLLPALMADSLERHHSQGIDKVSANINNR